MLCNAGCGFFNPFGPGCPISGMLQRISLSSSGALFHDGALLIFWVRVRHRLGSGRH